MNKRKDILIIGFALFSMFFGAGNLIFPPFLGYSSGENWIIAGIGFVIAAVGLTYLSVLSTTYAGGSLADISQKLGRKSGNLISFLVILFIGPLLAIPRTAATTHEVLSYSYGIPTFVTVLIFFSLVLFFCLRENSIIDNLGKFLTPGLLLALFLMIFKGIISPLGVPEANPANSVEVFTNSFQEGYQTMDLLASVVFTGLIMNSVIAKGYKDKKTTMEITIYSGLLATVLLAIIYLGLSFLGASVSTYNFDDLTRVELLIEISRRLYGQVGNVILSLAMALACLTTAVGLTSSAAEYFSGIFKKITYNSFCIIIAIVGAFFAINGVNDILSISAPMLTIFYPVIIVVVLLNLVDKHIPYQTIYQGAGLGALAVSILQGISGASGLLNLLNIQANLDPIKNIVSLLPFAEYGFPWLIPALIGGIIGYFIGKTKKTAL